MKTKNIFLHRFFCIAILALALCIAGTFNAGIKAKAAMLDPAGLITGTANVKATAGKANGPYSLSGTPRTHTGLTIESSNGSGGYSAGINGIFTGDFRMDFTFLGDAANGSKTGNFTVRFSDALDAQNPDKYFEVQYYPMDFWDPPAYTLAAMVYKDQTRVTTLWPDISPGDTRKVGVTKSDLAEAALTSPVFKSASQADYGNNFSPTGYIELKNTNTAGSMEVRRVAQNDWNVLLSRFDGTPAVVQGSSAENSSYGLPALTFPNGYKVSISSESANVTSVLIKSINGISLTGASLASEPGFYTSWINAITIKYENPPALVWGGGNTYYIPSATYQHNDNLGTVLPVYGATLQKGGGAVQNVTPGQYTAFALSAGSYTLTYTAVSGGTKFGNTLSVTIAVDDYVSPEYLAYADTSASVTAGKINGPYSFSGTPRTHTGLTVSGGQGYTAGLSGVYKGDFRMDFSFLGGDVAAGSKNGEFTIRFTDAVNSSKYFEVQYYSISNWYTGAVLAYNGQIRTTTTWEQGGVWITSSKDAYDPNLGWPAFASASMPDDAENHSPTGFIELINAESGIMEVRRSARSANRVMARFDNTPAIAQGSTAENGSYGLPSLNFPNGYKISFSSSYAGGGSIKAGTDICIKKINGISAEGTFMPGSQYENRSSLSLNGNSAVSMPATLDYVDKYSYDEGAYLTADARLPGGTLIKNLLITVYSKDTVDFKTTGNKVINYAFLDLSISRTIQVYKAAPVLDFASGKGDTVYRLSGPNASAQLILSASDIMAMDMINGILNLTGKVTISVKAPGAGSFTNVSAGSSFNPAAGTGSYIVRYTVEEPGTVPAQVYVECTVRVVSGGSAALVVNGTVPSHALLGGSVTLPAVTAVSGGVDISANILRTVTVNGDVREIENNALVFDVPGTYKIMYFVSDGSGGEDMEEFVITVLGDISGPPVISGAEMQSEAVMGSVITLPAATAVDSVGNALNVTITVKYGNEDVTVTGGKFTAGKAGVYTVAFRAEDMTGSFTVTECKIEVAPKKSSGGCGSVASFGFLPLSAAFIFIAAAFIIVKKPKRSYNII